MADIPSIDIFGMRVDMVQIPQVIDIIKGWIDKRQYHNYVAILTANEAVMGKYDSKLRDTVNESNLAVPDGISLIMLSRLRGFNLKKRVYGPDLFIEFLKTTQDKGYAHYFYGATETVNNALIDNLRQRFPGINIAGSYAPPFRQLTAEEENLIISTINKLKPDILWVGLSGEKQQLWMHQYRERLNVPAIVGIGAAFDFIAKTKPQAPHWIRNNGFEWLFRLVTEPKRLWRRYLINGSLFFCYLVKEAFLKPCKFIRCKQKATK